jgi:hypothetical protein
MSSKPPEIDNSHCGDPPEGARLHSYVEVHGRTGNEIKSNKVGGISVDV